MLYNTWEEGVAISIGGTLNAAKGLIVFPSGGTSLVYEVAILVYGCQVVDYFKNGGEGLVLASLVE